MNTRINKSKNRTLDLLILALLVFINIFIWSCNDAKKETENNNTNIAPKNSEREDLQSKYPNIPREEIINDNSELGKTLYTELCSRYSNHLVELNNMITANGAKMILVNITPEVGNSLTASQRIGSEFIAKTCTEKNIAYVDMASIISKYKPEEVTLMPKDGHWSENGSKLIASEFEKIIMANASQKSTKTFETSQRPSMFGDLKANNDEVLDGGKGLPYRVKTNAQGLRMNHDITFPKTKQRVLIMGDSELFFPFIENNQMASEILQSKMADRDIINASNWGYSIEDFASLYKDKTQYTESDIVIVSTNGNEILDMYFAHRNRFSRSDKAYQPTKLETDFYSKIFK